MEDYKDIESNTEEVMGMLAMKHDKKGEVTGPRGSLDNVRIVLENDNRFRDRLCYNEVDMKVYKATPFPWDTDDEIKPIDDIYDVAEMQRLIQRDYFQRPEDVKSQYIPVAMETRFHPIKMILEGVTWDGKEHIKDLMPKYLGVYPDDYQASVLRLVMLALIERQYHPGAKFDCVLALNGDQGLGKSTFCRRLAFDDDKYFTDALGDLTDKDTMQIVAGKRIIEFGEMLSLKKTKEQEAVKRFISATQDTFRPPYGRTFQDFPRQCIIIATTNDIDYLDDITGSRRWLPVECRADHVKDKMAIQGEKAGHDFIQAWAEAYNEWNKLTQHGKKPLNLVGMSYALSDEARKHAQNHEETDPMEADIEMYLGRLESIDGLHRVCAKQIAIEALGIDKPTRFDLKDISRIVDCRCKKWGRTDGKQKCGIYGTQRCWQCQGIGTTKATDSEPEESLQDMTEDDFDSYNSTFS